ncbi:MAG: glycoside hydrolase family 2 protein, partial [Bradyrhizobium sp.]
SWNDDRFREWCSNRNDTVIERSYVGKAWYRKHFTLDAAWTGRKVFIEFQAVYRIGNFYVNGQFVGLHENGVAPCGIDITDYVNFGADNVIAVQVNNDENAHTVSYGGATIPYGTPFNNNYGGLSRDAVLHISDKVYQTLPLYRNLGTTGTYIYPSAINTLAKTATLNVQTQIANDNTTSQTVTSEAVVVDRDGNAVLNLAAPAAQTIAAGQKATFTMTAPMTGIHFWAPDYPYLYRVYTITKIGGAVVDVYETPLGVRKLGFASNFGLQVNGRPLYLNGYAPRAPMEWPCVGTPNDWLTDYDFKLMKDSNANFIRQMHIAPRRDQVDAADKFGIVTT